MANTRCFVGNIPYATTELDLRSFFAPFELHDVYIITDHKTKRPRGFAFVEFKSASETQQIIAMFNGRVLKGRTINVRPAHKKPRSNRRERRINN
jgi:RNA recognition motif-containing protein